MKTYTINGKEIEKLELGEPMSLNSISYYTFSFFSRTENIINQLLEALDEKKDYSHDTKNCEVCKTGLTCRKYVDSITGNEKKEEPKSECNHDWGEYDRDTSKPIDVCKMCYASKEPKPVSKRDSYDNPEKTEFAMRSDTVYKQISKVEPKSTLREVVELSIGEVVTRPEEGNQIEPLADKILSLFKDTLKKEILKHIQPGLYVYEDDLMEIVENL